jgi:hypothetical protein
MNDICGTVRVLNKDKKNTQNFRKLAIPTLMHNMKCGGTRGTATNSKGEM